MCDLDAANSINLEASASSSDVEFGALHTCALEVVMCRLAKRHCENCNIPFKQTLIKDAINSSLHCHELHFVLHSMTCRCLKLLNQQHSSQ